MRLCRVLTRDGDFDEALLTAIEQRAKWEITARSILGSPRDIVASLMEGDQAGAEYHVGRLGAFVDRSKRMATEKMNEGALPWESDPDFFEEHPRRLPEYRALVTRKEQLDFYNGLIRSFRPS